MHHKTILKLFLITYLNLFALELCSEDSINYLRTTEYDALQISMDDLNEIVSEINYYFIESTSDSSSINITNGINSYRLRIDLSNKLESITLSSLKQFTDLNLKNKEFKDLRIIVVSDSNDISEVDINFNNSFRRLSVRGTDQRKVDALLNAIDIKLLENRQFLYWINWQTVYSVLISLLFLIGLPALVSISIDFLIKKVSFKLTIIIVLIAYVIGGFLYFLLSSYQEIFPRFRLTSDEIKWIDRNSGLLTLIGLIVTVVPGIIWFYKYLIKLFKRREEEKT